MKKRVKNFGEISTKSKNPFHLSIEFKLDRIFSMVELGYHRGREGMKHFVNPNRCILETH